MAGFLKCVNSCMRSQVPSNVHLRALNPHLDLTGWPAFFNTELKLMHGDAGYVGVSSFGFGGTNGHAMAWGKCIASSYGTGQDVNQAFIQKVSANMPKVKMLGNDPTTWQPDNGPDMFGNPGDQYVISMDEEELTWEKKTPQAPSTSETFSITGSFNSWGYMEMDNHPDIEHLYLASVTIGPNGSEEFIIVMEQDEEKALYPPTGQCQKKNSIVNGPNILNREKTWMIKGKTGEKFIVELFRNPNGGLSTVSWRKQKN